jgi:hypothetical protein
MAQNPQVLPKGREAWGKVGVLCRQTRPWPTSLYTGTLYDQSASVIVPKQFDDLPAIYTFLRSDEFKTEIRKIDSSMKLTNSTFVKVPFDMDLWREKAAERYAEGVPEPYSDDPTQWLFHGNPAFAEVGTQIHVALARLAGHRWPAESDADVRLSNLARERLALAAELPGADLDGLLTLHAAGGERPLADRLRTLLAAAYGSPITPNQEKELVRAADRKIDKKEARDVSLEGWLRDRAFRQHCLLFEHRPFLWQIWDGLRDGFSAFAYYHRLSHAVLAHRTRGAQSSTSTAATFDP